MKIKLNNMKTPMQTAIDKVSFIRNMCDDESNEMCLKHVLETFKKELQQLLVLEKEHIEDAFKNGWDVGDFGADCWEEIYYNEKYKTNKL